MTREEAIKIIDCYDIGFYDLSGEKIPADKLVDAFDMAIEALLADRPKNMIHIDDVYNLIAGHSNYHGDSILSAFTCLVEGKDVKPIAPLDESSDRPTGWIPVTERLPKRGIDVLVTRDYDGRKEYQRPRKYVEVAVCYGEDEDADWVSFSDEYKTTPEYHRVIAWMPLPEPWGEEE